MEKFFISIDSKSPATSLRKNDKQPLIQVKAPTFVLSDKLDVEVFVMNDGGVIQSASVSNNLILGIGEVRKDRGTRLLAYAPLTSSLSSYTGLLDLGTTELRDRIGSGSYADLTFEVQIASGSSRQTILQTDTVIRGDLLNDTEGFSINEIVDSVSLAQGAATSAQNSALAASISEGNSLIFADEARMSAYEAGNSATSAYNDKGLAQEYMMGAEGFMNESAYSAGFASSSAASAFVSANSASVAAAQAALIASELTNTTVPIAVYHVDSGSFNSRINAKLDRVSSIGPGRVYTINTSGAQGVTQLEAATAAAWTVVQRDDGGRVKVANATSEMDALNLGTGDARYVASWEDLPGVLTDAPPETAYPVRLDVGFDADSVTIQMDGESAELRFRNDPSLDFNSLTIQDGGAYFRFNMFPVTGVPGFSQAELRGWDLTTHRIFDLPDVSGRVAITETKTTTGDFTTGNYEGRLVINTFNNNYKVYADGAWRTITSW